MTPPVVLALDIATVTGWACGPVPSSLSIGASLFGAAAQPASGVYRIGYRGIADGAFYRNYEDWLLMRLGGANVGMLVFEAPILLLRKTSVATARRLMGLVAVTELVAERAGVPNVLEAHLQQIKKHATGNGRADKRMMIDAARRNGWTVADDNEADALWLWDYAGANWRRGMAGRGAA